MANYKTDERKYSKDIHIRVTEEEYCRLQQIADSQDLTISKSVRNLILKKSSGFSNDSDGDSVSGFNQKRTLVAIKNSFKKAQGDIMKISELYRRSLEARTSSGEPAVNTEQTIRVMSSILRQQVTIQDALNVCLRGFGETEIHVAATVSAVEQGASRIAERKEDVRARAAVASAVMPAPSAPTTGIPEKYLYMLTTTFNGPLIADAESFSENNYEKIRLQVQTVSFVGGKKNVSVLDVVAFKSQYAKIIPYLKKDKQIMVAGSFAFTARSYNGVQSQNAATVEANEISFLSQ